ncbi:hypothetical protein GCM10010286_05490 [Streptomyces toxytricini]|nr:hypothetical protein GCM10010286_05490 [Streptomyces toxytricini]
MTLGAIQLPMWQNPNGAWREADPTVPAGGRAGERSTRDGGRTTAGGFRDGGVGTVPCCQGGRGAGGIGGPPAVRRRSSRGPAVPEQATGPAGVPPPGRPPRVVRPGLMTGRAPPGECV